MAENAQKATALRRGWTTGACATAAAKSAVSALLDGTFDDPVTITLPGGQTPAFALAHQKSGKGWAEAGVIKDAGDDPDVTHGATIVVHVTPGPPGSGVTFHAGNGVGTVSKPGLPIGVGEPAINPVPRKMISEAITHVCALNGVAPDIAVTVSVPGGEQIAQKTWNPRLGIVGGLSILGTTGIVIPYSCSAWIHSIHRGVDVARAQGLTHIVGSTGDASEQAARARLGLPDEAYIDMGDFVGGFLKYVAQHPVATVTIAGGFAKMSKLAQGALDLHSARSSVDLDRMAKALRDLDAPDDLIATARTANTANEVLTRARAAGIDLADAVARHAQNAAMDIVRHKSAIAILITDRSGTIVAEAG